jgi:fucose permease
MLTEEEPLLERELKDKEHKQWRILCSSLYCISFIFVGGIISGLGPLIPIKAVESGLSETDFKVVFTWRGIGYLLGSFTAGESEKYLDSHRCISLGCFMIGLAAISSLYVDSLFLFTFTFFLMGIGMGNLDVMANTLIV